MNGGKNGFSNSAEFDFRPIGQAIRTTIGNNRLCPKAYTIYRKRGTAPKFSIIHTACHYV